MWQNKGENAPGQTLGIELSSQRVGYLGTRGNPVEWTKLYCVPPSLPGEVSG